MLLTLDKIKLLEHSRSYFAELILETGKYSFEDKVKIDVSSYQKFVGYKVTIKPSKRKDEYRTYFVLVSKDMKHLVFSQSTQKTDEEIIDIIKSLGKGEGLNSYDEFYNSFYTLPSDIKHEFVCFTTEKLSRRYARERNNAKWAKKMVGHMNSRAHFYSEEYRRNMWFHFLIYYMKIKLTIFTKHYI